MRLYCLHNAGRIESLQGAPLAPFKARAAAFIFDFLLIVLVATAVALPFAWRARERGETSSLVVHFDPFNTALGICALGLYFGLLTYFWQGRTLGKRLLGIRVLSLAGERLTAWQCISRALGYGSSAVAAGLGFFEYFQHPNRQTTHDRIAETIVVNDRTNQRQPSRKFTGPDENRIAPAPVSADEKQAPIPQR